MTQYAIARLAMLAFALLAGGAQSVVLAQGTTSPTELAEDSAKADAICAPKKIASTRSIPAMLRREQFLHCHFDAKTALRMQRGVDSLYKWLMDIKSVVPPTCATDTPPSSCSACAQTPCSSLDSLTAVVQRLNATLNLTNIAIAEMGKAVSGAIREPRPDVAVKVEATFKPQDVIPVRIVDTRPRRRWVEHALIGGAGIAGGILLGRNVGR